MTKLVQNATGSGLVWFRRDLRDHDHAALAGALATHAVVHCAFVFDADFLHGLEGRDPRVTFLWETVRELREALQTRGGGMWVLQGRPAEEIPRLARELGVAAVHANREYDPGAIARDEAAAASLRAAGIAFHTWKDQVVFEVDEVLTTEGRPFSVFTPYKRAWLARLRPEDFAAREPSSSPGRIAPAACAMPDFESLGFERRLLPVPAGMSGAARLLAAFRPRLREYAAGRDFPSLPGTSRLSAHLRYGTLSIREAVRLAIKRRRSGAEPWLGELVWREFFFAVLSAWPGVVESAFRAEFDALRWEEDEAAWAAWCEGRTGYPLVDAAMRELHAQGTMHNRLRMLTASFLVKDLGIDWRRGERHFAARLLDYDLAANNGGWQWCASTGCDAQPWFRIFNPVVQSRRFDPHGEYIRRWLPPLARVPTERVHAPWEMPPEEQHATACVVGRDYPHPIVWHDEARVRALARYKAVRAAA